MFRSLGLMAFLICFIGYWVYHLMNGPRSILTYAKIQNDRVYLQAELEKMHAANESLLSQIAGLRPETLDEDLLIERLYSMSVTLPGEMLLYEE